MSRYYLGGLAFLLILTSALVTLVRHDTFAATSFTFSAAADYGYTSHTKAVLTAIGKSGVNFHLAVGDLNYDYPRITAGQWSGYVTGALGHIPFEIVAGEHDTGDITQLETA